MPKRIELALDERGGLVLLEAQLGAAGESRAAARPLARPAVRLLRSACRADVNGPVLSFPPAKRDCRNDDARSRPRNADQPHQRVLSSQPAALHDVHGAHARERADARARAGYRSVGCGARRRQLRGHAGFAERRRAGRDRRFRSSPIFDPFSNFKFSYFANLKRVDITLDRGAPFFLSIPPPDPSVNVVVPYNSYWAARYAPDSTDAARCTS